MPGLIQRSELTRKLVVSSLCSTTCPACGGIKQKHHSLCRQEYFALPKAMQLALWKPGKGYEEALAALGVLEVEEFRVEKGLVEREH